MTTRDNSATRVYDTTHADDSEVTYHKVIYGDDMCLLMRINSPDINFYSPEADELLRLCSVQEVDALIRALYIAKAIKNGYKYAD